MRLPQYPGGLRRSATRARRKPGPAVPTLAPMLREVTPGVVNIAVRAHGPSENPLLKDPFFRRFFDIPDAPEQPRETSATGSGVIVDARRGYVLTNNHVVEEADAIEVTTKDNQRFHARLVGRDPGTDVAVLQIQGQGIQAVPFGDSDRLEVGDYVVAIGNPFGLGQTVTSASSARSGAAVSALRAMRTSFRPTPRSTPATQAARSSICAAG